MSHVHFGNFCSLGWVGAAIVLDGMGMAVVLDGKGAAIVLDRMGTAMYYAYWFISNSGMEE